VNGLVSQGTGQEAFPQLSHTHAREIDWWACFWLQTLALPEPKHGLPYLTMLWPNELNKRCYNGCVILETTMSTFEDWRQTCQTQAEVQTPKPCSGGQPALRQL
jgi:hypothetical protein